MVNQRLLKRHLFYLNKKIKKSINNKINKSKIPNKLIKYETNIKTKLIGLKMKTLIIKIYIFKS